MNLDHRRYQLSYYYKGGSLYERLGEH